MALQHTAGGALLMTSGGALADECCCGGPPPDECTWFLSPDALQFDCNAQSGSFNINVPTGTNCGWEASVTSGGAYLTITAGSTGNTDGTVDFDILGNPDPQRTATITVVTTVVSPLGPIGTVIGTFTMTQESCEDAPFPPGCCPGLPPQDGSTCSWSVGPTNFLLSCFPQGAFFNVNTQLGCDWEAVIISGGSFITITSGTPGGDAGSVFFTVSANAGVARGGQIEVRTLVTSSYGPIGTVVGLVNIAQMTCPGGGGGAPCSWGVGPSWYISDPCAGETKQSTVFTYAGCGWEAISQAPWITITSGSTGLSTGVVTFDVDPNNDGVERVGYIFVYSTTASVLGPAGIKIGSIGVKEPTCCFCDPANPDFAPSYAIEGYVDGLLTACPECVASGDPAWSGVFDDNASGGFNCTFQPDPAQGGLSIDGKFFQYVLSTFDNTQITTTSGPCAGWSLKVTCLGPAFVDYIIWQGIKLTGSTPAGVYAKTGGCAAGPATLTII